MGGLGELQGLWAMVQHPGARHRGLERMQGRCGMLGVSELRKESRSVAKGHPVRRSRHQPVILDIQVDHTLFSQALLLKAKSCQVTERYQLMPKQAHAPKV